MIRRRSVGSIMYDSAGADACLGARSAPSDERSVVFRGAGLTVDIVLHDCAGQLRYVHGQVVDGAGTPVVGAFARLDGHAEPAETDAFGQFALAAPAASHDDVITVEVGPRELVCTIPREDAYTGGTS